MKSIGNEIIRKIIKNKILHSSLTEVKIKETPVATSQVIHFHRSDDIAKNSIQSRLKKNTKLGKLLIYSSFIDRKYSKYILAVE